MISGYSNLPKWISDLINNNLAQLLNNGGVDIENIKGAYNEIVDIFGDNPKMPILSKNSLFDLGTFALSWSVMNNKETEGNAANITFWSHFYYLNVPITIMVVIVRDPYPITIRLVMDQDGA